MMRAMTPTVEARFSHLHMRAADPGAAASWYREHFGCVPVAGPTAGGAPALRPPPADCAEDSTGPLFVWDAATGKAPARSIGSTLDHYGWSVTDLDGWHRRLCAAGCTSLQEPMEIGDRRLRISFLEDPFGCKLELLADADLLGWHHVHLLVPEAGEHRDWWHRRFGGEARQFNGLLPGLRFAVAGATGRAWWLLFRETDDALAPTAGRVVDRIVFRVGDVDQAARRLERSGAPLIEAPGELDGVRGARIEAPGGVQVELQSAPRKADG